MFQAMVNWPIRPTRNLPQRFLGFGDFIRNYNKIPLPLTTLTSKVPFQWKDSAQKAFNTLTEMFSCSDPVRSLRAVKDLSGSGTEAVSLQQKEVKLHPCAFSLKVSVLQSVTMTQGTTSC